MVTSRCNYAEILIALEIILGIAATPKHPIAHNAELRALQQDLLFARHSSKDKTQERNISV